MRIARNIMFFLGGFSIGWFAGTEHWRQAAFVSGLGAAMGVCIAIGRIIELNLMERARRRRT